MAGFRLGGLSLVALAGAAVLTLALAAPGQAHWADLAVAEIDVYERQTQVVLTFPTGLVDYADGDRDGQLSPEEVRAHRTDLENFLRDRIILSEGSLRGELAVEFSPVPAARPDLSLTPGSHSTVRLVYAWPRPIDKLTIRYDLFLPDVPTASALATIRYARRVQTVVFTPEHRQVSIPLARSAIRQQAWSFLLLGVRHIVTGYDHILFLLTLLLLGGGLRSLLKIVTAFTVAHSATLSLAVLGFITLPSRLVESGIALSIAYVAAENIWFRNRALRSRWFVTFAFGLIHGLGFATILREMAIDQPSLALSLGSFNLGVEAGQVATVAVVWMGLQLLHRVPGESAARRWASAVAAATGLVWFIQRAVLGS